MEAIGDITLTKKNLKKLHTDNAASAEAVNLVYVSDGDAGIVRKKTSTGFKYTLNGRTVRDAATLKRIRSLVIPPAWEQVWICNLDNGHLQCTGIDVKGRKQYKYHHHWTELRAQTKFFHLHELGKALPGIRKRLEADLKLPGLPQAKVLATAVAIMQETGIRIGNGAYEKLYGSFGLSTLKDQHVTISGADVRFAFRGKKGVYQKITLKNQRLAKIIKSCRDIPGKELFQYYDGDEHFSIDSGMVNDYIRDISGGHFTAKDFRTWTGTIHALKTFRELGCANTATETKSRIIAVLDAVSVHLGNTRTVCKKYYVHPALLHLYECRDMEKYLRALEKFPVKMPAAGLTAEEQVLMKILAQQH